MEFTIDRIEIEEEADGIKIAHAYNRDNEDWYNVVDKFSKTSFKILVDNTSNRVISSTYEASALPVVIPNTTVKELEDFDNSNLDINNLYYIDNKLVNLSEYEIYENGAIKVNRLAIIRNLKYLFSDFKNMMIKKGMEVKPGIFQPLRETDVVSLLENRGKPNLNKEWKFYNNEGEPVIDYLTNDLIEKIFREKSAIIDKIIIGDVKAKNSLETLSDKELTSIDPLLYYEKFTK